MHYPSDLRDIEWRKIEIFFTHRRAFGRPQTYCRRSIVNAIFYVTKSGCQWRMLPRDFPNWTTVYYYFQKWCRDGIWEQVLDCLNKQDRLRKGRNACPSLAILDSQSSKTQYNSDDRGIDGGKKN